MIARSYMQRRVLEPIRGHEAKQCSAVGIGPGLVREVYSQSSIRAKQAVGVMDNAARGGPGTRIGNGPNCGLRKCTDLRQKKDRQAQQKL